MAQRFAGGHRTDRSDPPRSHHGYAVLSQLAALLSTTVGALPPGDVLDLGCANRPYEGLLAGRGFRYTGADLPGNPDADLTLSLDGTVPGDRRFDYVLSTQTLEHVQDVQRYLREAHRVLAHGGRLILSTHGIYRYHPDPDDYWRWTSPGLRLELARAGFAVEQQSGILSGPATAIQLWQDVTLRRVPGPVRRLYQWVCQRAIGWADRGRGARAGDDACVYLIVASKAPPA